MSKTYSVAILDKNGYWLTNYGQYFNLDEIAFEEVENHCISKGYLAYGYYYGKNSRNLTSPRCRTVVKILNSELYTALNGGK